MNVQDDFFLPESLIGLNQILLEKITKPLLLSLSAYS